MKRISFLIIAAASCFHLSAQVDYDGAYGYSLKPVGHPPNPEKTKGPSGSLVLVKMENNKYRFWLDVSIGWPTYNVGETDGTIILVNDTATFDNTFENATNPCLLKFRVNNNVININSFSASYNCGFGNGVHADGDYTLLKKQPVLDNKWLRNEYSQSPTMMVNTDMAELFQDENAKNSFNPKQYFHKGDALLSIAETEKTMYTEYFLSPGKFVYGWIKKENLTLTSTK